MSVLNIIRKIKEKDHEIRLLILGLDNAGKTTILKRFLEDHETIDDISPTVGFNIKTTQYSPSMSSESCSDEQSAHLPTTQPADREFTVTIWDIGGQSTIRSFWSNYFTHTDGIVWVIDSTDISRFDVCIEALQGVLKQEKLSGISLLILANKQDVPFSHSLSDLRTHLQLDEIVTKATGGSHHWFIQGCSARQNRGIKEGFDLLLKDIIDRMYSL